MSWGHSFGKIDDIIFRLHDYTEYCVAHVSFWGAFLFLFGRPQDAEMEVDKRKRS